MHLLFNCVRFDIQHSYTHTKHIRQQGNLSQTQQLFCLRLPNSPMGSHSVECVHLCSGTHTQTSYMCVQRLKVTSGCLPQLWFETGSFSEPEACQFGQIVSPASSGGLSSVSSATLSTLSWDLEIQTQVPILVQQSLSQLSARKPFSVL